MHIQHIATAMSAELLECHPRNMPYDEVVDLVAKRKEYLVCIINYLYQSRSAIR